MKINIIYKTIVCMILLMSFQMAASAPDSEPLSVYTVNYPLQYFARRIAGPHARVVFPAPADVDPAFWQPDIETIIEYQRANLVLLNGAAYARWVNNVSLPAARLVNTSAAFRDDYIEIKASTTHRHGPGGDHSHAGTAFTTWLDLSRAVQQARAITDALIERRPGLEGDFERGFEALEQELQALDSELRSVLNTRTQPVLASHPVYQYLARGYGLNLESVTWEPGEPPSAAQWSELRLLLTDHPARWMLWEDEPAPETARQLQGLGIDIAVFRPCANKPEQGDFISVMRSNLEQLKTLE